MLGITILIFEVLMIIFYGIFMRTDATSTTSLTSLDSGLFFTVGIISVTQPSLSWPPFAALLTGQCFRTFYLS